MSRNPLIVSVHVSQYGNDRRILGESLGQVPEALRKEITHVVADTGYDNTDLICAVKKKWGSDGNLPIFHLTAWAVSL